MEPGDLKAFAKAWSDVLDDDQRRSDLAEAARQRVSSELDWAPQAEIYVRVWEDVLQMARPIPATDAAWPHVDRRLSKSNVHTDHLGREFVDLRRGNIVLRRLLIPDQRLS